MVLLGLGFGFGLPHLQPRSLFAQAQVAGSTLVGVAALARAVPGGGANPNRGRCRYFLLAYRQPTGLAAVTDSSRRCRKGG
jgi:hypothetical protein